ncbi:MAG: AAA family ATPase [Patescibacteria group bacterium]
MLTVPKEIYDFINWYFVKAPRVLFVTLLRILRHTNNEVAFTLNIRLLFTPLFGDYTKVGRIIGFFFRIIWMLVGSVALVFISILLFIAPIIWFLAPLLLAIYIKLWIIPLIVMLFVAREYFTFGTPLRRVYQVNPSNPLECFRPEVKDYIEQLKTVGSEALPLFLKHKSSQYILKRTELLKQDFLLAFVELYSRLQNVPLVETSYGLAKKYETRYVEMEHLLLAVFLSVPNIDTVLSSYGSSLEDFEDTIEWVVSKREELSKLYVWQEDYEMPLMGGTNRGLTGRVTKYLDQYSDDYTEMAKYGRFKKVVGRDAEISEVAEILSSSNSNVLIIGEPGSGKSSIMKGIADRVIRGTDFESLRFRRIVALNTGLLIAGASTSGDLAGRMANIMEDVEGSGGIILFIDEIHTLLAGSGQSSAEMSSAFSVLEPRLAAGKNQFVGATSNENYRKYIEPNGAFARLFEIVRLAEASEEDTLEILKVNADEIEKETGVIVSYPALRKIIQLSKKLIHERVFPDKALDILNRSVASFGRTKGYLTVDDVADEVSKITSVPVSAISQDESSTLLNIEDKMRQMVVGQDQAIVQIGRSLKRARVGIRDESKPIASFLFVGTTGVGKTQTAKALAKNYFGTNNTMIRLDMSEYQQPDSINRLIGDPSGSSKGQLTDAVRSKPFSLILLDEIEKAYSNVLLTFLQVLDDGRLTDSVGHVVDFTNSIIIATSNTGTRAIQEISDKGGTFEEMQDAAMREVRAKFAPEFLNRFTGIIVFRPLTIPTVRAIADILLEGVRRLADEKKVKISFSQQLIDELVRRGFNPSWGARPLARVIEDTVETYLATKILQGEIKMGDTVELGMEVFEESY